jgi:hypothetical protein
MKDTSERVVKVTTELQTLLKGLQWSAFQNSSQHEQKQILNEVLNGGLVEDLRKAIDQLSDFLWRYIECAASGSGPDADLALENLRLMRMTELLRLLHRSSCPSHDPRAFVERVTASVEQHLETHNNGESRWERSA